MNHLLVCGASKHRNDRGGMLEYASNRGFLHRATDLLQLAMVDHILLENWAKHDCPSRRISSSVFDVMVSFSQIWTRYISSNFASNTNFGTTLLPMSYKVTVGDHFEQKQDESSNIIQLAFQFDDNTRRLPFSILNMLNFLGKKYNFQWDWCKDNISAVQQRWQHQVLQVFAAECLVEPNEDVEEDVLDDLVIKLLFRQHSHALLAELDDIIYFLRTFHLQVFGSAICRVVEVLENDDQHLGAIFGYKIHEHAAMWCFPSQSSTPRVGTIFHVAIRNGKDVSLWNTLVKEFVMVSRHTHAQGHRVSVDFFTSLPEKLERVVDANPVDLGARVSVGYLVAYSDLTLFRGAKRMRTISSLLHLPHVLNEGVVEMKRALHERMRVLHRDLVQKENQCSRSWEAKRMESRADVTKCLDCSEYRRCRVRWS